MKTKLLVFLLAMAGCDFGVENEERSGATAVQESSALYSAPVQGAPGSQMGGDTSSMLAGAAETGAEQGPDASSRSPCSRTLSNGVAGLCLPAPQTGDKSHGDPQPWQPSPVPQPY